MTGMKYVLAKSKLGFLPFIFANPIEHHRVAVAMGVKDDLVSAGFVSLDAENQLYASGKSTSLHLFSREEDTEILRNANNFPGHYAIIDSIQFCMAPIFFPAYHFDHLKTVDRLVGCPDETFESGGSISLCPENGVALSGANGYEPGSHDHKVIMRALRPY